MAASECCWPASNQNRYHRELTLGEYGNYEGLSCTFPEPGLLQIAINNPDNKMNTVTAGMHTALTRVWTEIDADPDVKVVLFTGTDGVFCAGGDFEFIASLLDDWDRRQTVMKEVRDLVHGMVNCSKPVVSAISGPCAGVGAAVALLADISVATPSTVFIDGHTRFGVAAGDQAVIHWPLLCGMAKAKYYLLLSEKLDGREAERIGLVTELVDEDALDDRAMAIAQKLNRLPRNAVQWTKQALNGWFKVAAPMFDVSAAYENLSFSDPDSHEGVKALQERRAPTFR
jgi:enoyl-CoA hydratase